MNVTEGRGTVMFVLNLNRYVKPNALFRVIRDASGRTIQMLIRQMRIR